MTSPRVLLLPGWQNSADGHWQTRWQRQHGFERLQQDDWWWPRRGDWMIRLEENLLADERPAVLVADRLGCHLVTAWAAHSQHTARVVAALLVAAPDLRRGEGPSQLQAWAPVHRQRLPFASTAVLSAGDPFSPLDRSLALAAAWGSEVVNLGPAGHSNGLSGHSGHSGPGDWPQGLALLHGLLRGAAAA
ncbi:MAG: alpha/beta hydrolase [Microbacteriaceae bacterium]|nr:alpha/beta hydrolase [Burkholderiaceae bacterium]